MIEKLSKLKRFDKVLFIPYTTDCPKITEGIIEKDFYGKNFISYNGKYCDDGEYFISTKQTFENNKSLFMSKLNEVLRRIYNDRN